MWRALRLPLVLLPVGVVALLLVAVVRSPLRIAADPALYVEAGELLLEGKRPYVDFVDVNPPLIMYVSAVPALVARFGGLHPVYAFNALVLALVAWSTWAVRRRLGALRVDAAGLAPDVVAAAFAAFSVWLWLGAPWGDTNDYGQREHLFVLLWLPYALLRCEPPEQRRIGRGAAIALGIAAGVGACLKPHLLLLVLVVELVLLVTRRSPRALLAPETCAFAGVALLYAAHFALLPAEVRGAFFGRWLPLATKYYGTYKGRRAGVPVPLLHLTLALGLGAAVAAQIPLLRRRNAGALIASLGALAAGGVAVHDLQDKGFPYHQIPAQAGLVVLVAVLGCIVVGGLVARVLANGRVALAHAAVGLLGWIVLARDASMPLHVDEANRFLPVFEKLVESYAEPGEPIAILSTAASPEYPTLVQLERHQATRFLSLVYLALAWRAAEEGDPQPRQRILDDLAADLQERRPPFIAVSNGRCVGCVGGTFVPDLLAYPPLAEVLASYQPRPARGLPPASVLFIRGDRADRAEP